MRANLATKPARLEDGEGSSYRDAATDRFSLFGENFLELRLLARVEFYRALGRRPPTQLKSLPSYVRSVQRHFDLPSRNQARFVLARLEGFDSWRDLVAEMMSEI